MRRFDTRKRPWLAAVLGALLTGLGHCYIGRWRRALLWATGMVVAAMIVGPAALASLTSGGTVDLLAIAPLLVLGSLSAADAYLLAHVQNAIARAAEATEKERTHCPACGGELDPMLDFCHWCTTELEDATVTRPDDGSS